MGGPIVRTGTNPAYWANWENVFGKGAKAAAKSEAKTPAKAKKAAKSTKAKKKKK
ncbi:MAG: hypothetical protein JSS02_26540 [Planctomycetes bacterium]|nr:hypothetical protein [Planctomycetota bacterium]